jgi:hypothetical protein
LKEEAKIDRYLKVKAGLAARWADVDLLLLLANKTNLQR